MRTCPVCEALLNPWTDKVHEQVCPRCGTTIKNEPPIRRRIIVTTKASDCEPIKINYTRVLN